MLKRYHKNLNTLTENDMDILNNKKVCVIGCGGLGGYVIEMIARIGIHEITVIDGDVFNEDNLNRQLLSDERSIGIKKTLKAKERIGLINSNVRINCFDTFIDENNINIIDGHDVIVDALDNIKSRFIVQKYAEKYNIPFIHGAIAGWYGQVTTIFPGDNTLNKIYKSNNSGEEKKLGNPSFTPALVSSIQVSEVIKVILNKGDILRNKILFINTLNQEYELINL